MFLLGLPRRDEARLFSAQRDLSKPRDPSAVTRRYSRLTHKLGTDTLSSSSFATTRPPSCSLRGWTCALWPAASATATAPPPRSQPSTRSSSRARVATMSPPQRSAISSAGRVGPAPRSGGGSCGRRCRARPVPGPRPDGLARPGSWAPSGSAIRPHTNLTGRRCALSANRRRSPVEQRIATSPTGDSQCVLRTDRPAWTWGDQSPPTEIAEKLLPPTLATPVQIGGVVDGVGILRGDEAARLRDVGRRSEAAVRASKRYLPTWTSAVRLTRGLCRPLKIH